jgi:hypothetical protein
MQHGLPWSSVWVARQPGPCNERQGRQSRASGTSARTDERTLSIENTSARHAIDCVIRFQAENSIKEALLKKKPLQDAPRLRLEARWRLWWAGRDVRVTRELLRVLSSVKKKAGDSAVD